MTRRRRRASFLRQTVQVMVEVFRVIRRQPFHRTGNFQQGFAHDFAALPFGSWSNSCTLASTLCNSSGFNFGNSAMISCALIFASPVCKWGSIPLYCNFVSLASRESVRGDDLPTKAEVGGQKLEVEEVHSSA